MSCTSGGYMIENGIMKKEHILTCFQVNTVKLQMAFWSIFSRKNNKLKYFAPTINGNFGFQSKFDAIS